MTDDADRPAADERPASRLIETLSAVLGNLARPSAVLKTILHQAVAQTSAERGVFVEVGRSGRMTYRVLYRFEREELAGPAGSFSATIFARVLETGEGIVLGNAMEDSRFDGSGSIHDLNLVSVMSLPIRVGGEIAALVHLEHTRPDHFTERHRRLVESLLELSGPVLAALRAGADVIQQNDALRQTASRAREHLESDRDQLTRDWSFGRFVGRSAAVRALGHSVAKAARSESPVLLTGETGTGKSILARVLHHQSRRRNAAMVTVFCPSLERGMVEAELFGHRRGAFTGAVADRVGKVQAAEDGTLFLDEIGELPLEIQPKLLRLLQEKTYERVGDAVERIANVRVIAATNRDIRREVQIGRFRRDLYERLNFVPIRVPPLRDRRYDIPVLLRHCLDQHDQGRWIEVSPDAERYLMELDFAWPGNVRHVEQMAARLALERFVEPVTVGDLESVIDADREAADDGEGSRPSERELEAGLPAFLAHAEKRWLVEALRRYSDLSKKELARKLNIGESTLHKKIRQYGISA
ncbi:MAG TPA: sigma-54-dependent Fis family transcriptional regulator [Candidatus Polarisedimenticolaceae bacterium]|nr:sigma-54-dependent Fis family transcriptional regulator [Candidatus Polarisedimenticolaceae bacterium]